MKTKKVALVMPLLASIGFGIISLAVPFLLANHYIWAEGKKYSADNYLFFLWGKYYTVAGSKMIQSQMVMYDFGDYSIYAMIGIIIGLILATISIFGGRGLILNIKGREFKLKIDTNPIWLQIYAALLFAIAYVYMREGTRDLITALLINNYIVEYGPSLDFLLGSIVAIVISVSITAAKYLKTKDIVTAKKAV